MDSASTLGTARTHRDGPTPGRDLARIAIEAALSKKALDVTVMDLRGISGEVDYFVIATGESDLQMKAIVEGIVVSLREEAGERPMHREGHAGSSQWIVLDYFDLAVHIFTPEAREHYDLERLWGDAPSETVSEDAATVALLEGDGEPSTEEASVEDDTEA